MLFLILFIFSTNAFFSFPPPVKFLSNLTIQLKSEGVPISVESVVYSLGFDYLNQTATLNYLRVGEKEYSEYLFQFQNNSNYIDVNKMVNLYNQNSTNGKVPIVTQIYGSGFILFHNPTYTECTTRYYYTKGWMTGKVRCESPWASTLIANNKHETGRKSLKELASQSKKWTRTCKYYIDIDEKHFKEVHFEAILNEHDELVSYSQSPAFATPVYAFDSLNGTVSFTPVAQSNLRPPAHTIFYGNCGLSHNDGGEMN